MESTTEMNSRRPLLVVLLAMALLFAAIFPTLPRVEFGRTLENLNIATALEARRDGHWMIPTLEGQPRTKKPPLTAWITALAISPATVRECSSTDSSLRHAAFERLAREARLPALVMACLTLLAVYWLGKTVGGTQLGARSALIAGSSYLFIRYAQVSLTDVPLMLWVMTANAFIAIALFDRRTWFGSIGAGAAIGLAFMSKGPVVFVQTVAPLVVWLGWKALFSPSSGIPGEGRGGGSTESPASAKNPHPNPPPEYRGRGPITPVIVGILVCLLIAIPWYLIVLLKDPAGQWNTWFKEVTGTDAPERADAPFIYGLYVFVMIFPWIPFWIGGLWLSLRDAAGASSKDPPWRQPRLADRFVFLLCLVLVPVLVMTFFKDKKERYLLPMIGPAAVLTARCIRAYCAERPEAKRDWVGWLHWGMLAVVAIGLPILGSWAPFKALRTVEGRPWFAPGYAAVVTGVGVFLLAVGWRTHVSGGRGIVFVSFLLMLLVGEIFMHGYRETSSGRSLMRPLAERIWATYPDAELFNALPLGERSGVDLSIYLNRTTGWITRQEIANPVPGKRPKVILMRRVDVGTAQTQSDRWKPLGDDVGEWRALVLDRAK